MFYTFNFPPCGRRDRCEFFCMRHYSEWTMWLLLIEGFVSCHIINEQWRITLLHVQISALKSCTNLIRISFSEKCQGLPVHPSGQIFLCVRNEVVQQRNKGYNSKNSFLIQNLSPTTSLMSMKEQKVPENEPEQVGLLNAVDDLYDGVVVEMSNKEHMESNIFIPLLRASILQWKQQGKRSIWIKLPIELSNLVHSVCQEGFRYHHAEPDYLMLVRWLPSTPDTLPVNATHRVGIGAFVVNDNKEVLVVQEKGGGFKGTGLWKLPTGVVNEGEDICKAAIREVKEETGIEAEFVEILAFRQSHQSFFSKSDLFFVCLLKAHFFDIQKQDSEIEAAQWMPIEDYVNQPYNQQHPLFKYVAEICKTKTERDYVGFSARPAATASGKETYLYFNNRDFTKL